MSSAQEMHPPLASLSDADNAEPSSHASLPTCSDSIHPSEGDDFPPPVVPTAPKKALRAGHTACAPQHTGPSTGLPTDTTVSQASPTSTSMPRPAALTAGEVLRGGPAPSQGSSSEGRMPDGADGHLPSSGGSTHGSAPVSPEGSVQRTYLFSAQFEASPASHRQQRPRPPPAWKRSGMPALATSPEALARHHLSPGHSPTSSFTEQSPTPMALMDLDSSYPYPALNSHTPKRRSWARSPHAPSSPITPDKVIGGTHTALPARIVDTETSSATPHSPASAIKPAPESTYSPHTPVIREGTGKFGYRDIIGLATMSPLEWLYSADNESDDDLHNPGEDPKENKQTQASNWFTARLRPRRNYREEVQKNREEADVSARNPVVWKRVQATGIREVLNCTTLVVVVLAVLMLFAGYPIYTHYSNLNRYSKMGGYGLGGANSTGQLGGALPGIRTTLIDPDTPQNSYSRLGHDGVTVYNLVFSDEFNTPGRSFYPGDDPFWEAVNLHYWQTNNYEWYDPAAITTRDGALAITLSQHPEHNLNFRGGMIQSWNKFCFTGGIISVSVRLPGQANVAGLWPAIWMMGNLGRAGYGASLEGTWPYTYDSCDTGTMANQTDPATGLPNSTTLGDCIFNAQFGTKALSFLAGQKLSSCTCPGEDHPGPKRKDGTFKGRAAPELDIFEAQVSRTEGMTVSQSLQLAPFNAYYKLSQAPELYNPKTIMNFYTGERTQQAASAVTPTDQNAVQYLRNGSTGIFAQYSVEYEPGDDGFIYWESDGKPAWILNATQLQPDPVAGISRRPVPEEPLYIIMNVGVSENFGSPAWSQFKWPNTMEVDWVRVYQHGEPRVGCDPDDFPTREYINRHIEAYTNPNLTLWGNTRDEGGYGQPWPRNRLYPRGCSAPASVFPGSPLASIPQAPSFPFSDIDPRETNCVAP